MKEYPDEKILEDDYPIYAGFLYVVNGKVIEAWVNCVAKQLKVYYGTQDVRNCRIFDRLANKDLGDGFIYE